MEIKDLHSDEKKAVSFPKFDEKINEYFPLQADRFISVLTRYPEISYHTTFISTGNIQLQRVEIPNQQIFKGAPANKTKTEDIMIEFVVDDKLKNYYTIEKWIKDAIHWCFSDLIIYVYSSCDDNRLVGIFTYINVFPVFLSALEFRTTLNDKMQATNTTKARMQLTFDSQTFEKIN